MPASDIPVIRQPFQPGDLLPYWAMAPTIGDHHLYDLDVDPFENENRVGEKKEKAMLDLLHQALTDMQAPREQFQRLGLR